MKTGNWQTIALTLFIAAAALWLAAACGNNEVAEYAIGDRITPSAPCGPGIPLTPSREYITLEGAKVPSGFEKELEAAKSPRMMRTLMGIEDPEERERFIHNVRSIARAERLRPERERIEAILEKYEERFLRKLILRGGNVHGYSVEALWTENGLLTDKFVIAIFVIEYIGQGKLPSEERIPECMEDVEVHFLISPMFSHQ